MTGSDLPLRKDRIDALGAGLLIVFSAMLGLNQVLMKLVNQGMNPVFQAGLRSMAALVPVLLYVWWRRRRIAFGEGVLLSGIVCSVFFALEFLFLFKALDFTSVTRSSVFFYSMPIWVAVFAHFLIPGEKLTRLRVGGLALATLGVVVALARNDHPATQYALVGDLMALAGAMCWAAILPVTRLSRFSAVSPEMQLVYYLVVSGPVLLALAPLFGPLWRDMTPVLWTIFTFQAVGIVAVGFIVWLWVLSVYPSSDMASFAFLAPVFGVTFGWLILDEPITLNIVIALALVGTGIWLVNRRSKTPA